MSQTQQNVSGMNYFCCGNPFDEIFGSTKPVPQDHAQKSQQQDWNNPFANSYQPYQNDEVRFSDETSSTNRSVKSDSRSVESRRGSGGSIKMKLSNLEGKSLKDIEREEQARVRAIKLQESLLEVDAKPGMRTTSKLVSRETDEKLQKIRAAIDLKRQQQSVDKTETTRPKKELTAEDVRDPETVPGMKCKMDVEREEESKKKALEMISNGHYPYDKKAGVAIYSLHNTKNNTRKTNKKVNEIV